MGGIGSGRKPSVDSILRNSKPIVQERGEELILPNLSGVKHEISSGTNNITTDNLVEGSTNKYYSDSQVITDGSNVFLQLSGSNANQTINTGSYGISTTASLSGGAGYFSGNVSIGTTSVGNRLTVTTAGSAGANLYPAKLSSNSEGGTPLYIYSDGGGSGIANSLLADEYIYMFNSGGGGMQLAVGGAARMSINSSGKVGIGISSPSNKLSVSGGAVYISNQSTPSIPSDGAVLFSSGGAMYVRGSSGTITLIGAA